VAPRPEPVAASVPEVSVPPVAPRPEPVAASVPEVSVPPVAPRPEPVAASVPEVSAPPVAPRPEPVAASVPEVSVPPVARRPEPVAAASVPEVPPRRVPPKPEPVAAVAASMPQPVSAPPVPPRPEVPAAAAPKAQPVAPASAADASQYAGMSVAQLRELTIKEPANEAVRHAVNEHLKEDRAQLIRFYRDLVSEQPNEPEHVLNLARAYVEKGSDTLAVIQYQKFIKTTPTVGACEELAATYERMGKDDLAKIIRKKAERIRG
ncbi:MAG: hypothetical protein HY319_26175, partial [Armatimonadetes bacterium]|nr:hypothetical protein [Armatimonadota bacterium]